MPARRARTEEEQVTEDALTRLRAEIDRCPFHDLLRPQALHADADAGTVRVGLPFRTELGIREDGDTFHGGVIASLADLAGHAAVAVRTGRVSPTIDLRIDYLRAARGEALVATATVLRAGRSIARVDVHIHDPGGALVAVARGRSAPSPDPTPRPEAHQAAKRPLMGDSRRRLSTAGTWRSSTVGWYSADSTR
ncbi:PaaI family thioesterase [Blastococcus brunescens]|uniref:PaaI family thioesterase n=1 Tax=Blastococcus brunescens TaxID=1564165 RepID=UPI003BEF4663